MGPFAPLLCVLVAAVAPVFGFNIDLQSYVKYEGPEKSLFGFSVAALADGYERWVIVGAPEAQSNQPNVANGGVVYQCRVNSGFCRPIVFNADGNTVINGSEIDTKSYQWFGATVSSENGAVLACAPRYVWYTTQKNRRDPVGTCYTGRKNFTEILEFSPCRTSEWGYHRQGSCQAGLGAAVSKDGQRIFIGGPGSWYWQGQLFSLKASGAVSQLFDKKMFFKYKEGVVASQNLYSRPDFLATKEGPYAYDNSYLGYSVASGYFNRTKKGPADAAVGVPKGENLLGKVVLLTWDLRNIHNISGEQLGAYFGYSICSGDIDGDSHDDLIVGAPLYTNLDNSNWNYENGRVYVIYQGSRGLPFQRYTFLEGKHSKARFGLALTSLGDINLDGFGDFAVGAPYDGPNERGAVYIYHGSSSTDIEKAAQKILAEDVQGDTRTFGFSLAGGVDMDHNEYPDLIIGAYDSAHSFLFKSSPVVKIDAFIQYTSPDKEINLADRQCTIEKRPTACTELKICLKYSGIGVAKELDFDVKAIVDSKNSKIPRMHFKNAQKSNVQVSKLRATKGQQACITHNVYMKHIIRDKLTSLDAEVKIGLPKSQYYSTMPPVLDTTNEHKWQDSLAIHKNCGHDQKCIPDLRLVAKPNVTTYLLGSGQRLAIEVTVQNKGEDAFEATYQIKLPPGLNYVKVVSFREDENVSPIICSPPSLSNNNTLICDIGNPLPKEKKAQFQVILQPYNLEGGMKPKYEFTMLVNSTNQENETSLSDNFMKIDLPIWVRTELQLEGLSSPKDIHYNVSQFDGEIFKENDIGPQVVHTYVIRNVGPSDFLEGEVQFLWPSYTLTGEPLLYLLEYPETTGPIQCEMGEGVNPRNIILEEAKRKKYGESNLENSRTSALSSSGSSHHSSSQSHSSSFSTSSSGGTRYISHSTHKQSGDGLDRNGKRLEKEHHAVNGGKLESDAHISRGRPSSGSTVYEEERHSSRNTSWRSGEKPVTTSVTSWRVNKDGEVRNGSSTHITEDDRYYERGGSWDRGHGYSSHTNEGDRRDGRRRFPDSSIGSAEDPSTVTRGGNRHEYEERHSEHRVTSGSGSSYGEGGRHIGGSHATTHLGEGGRHTGGSHGTTHLGEGGRHTGGSHTTTTYLGEGSRHMDKEKHYGGSHTTTTHVGTGEERHYSGEGGTHTGGSHRTNYIGGGGKHVDEERHYGGSEGGRHTGGSHTSTTYLGEGGRHTGGSHTSTTYLGEGGRHTGGSATHVDEERHGGSTSSHVSGGGKYHEDHRSSGHSYERNGSRHGVGIDQNTVGTSGSGTYSKEWEKSYNTTWGSDRKPVTHTSTSWKENVNGKETSGGSSDVFEGYAPKLDNASESHGAAGRTHTSGTYSKEWEKNYNTTWGSDKKPVTHTTTLWKENVNGKETSGGSSDVYEGHAPSFDNAGESRVTAGRTHSSGTLSKEEKVTHRVTSSETETGRTTSHVDVVGRGSSGVLGERRHHNRNNFSSVGQGERDEKWSVSGSSGHTTEGERRTYEGHHSSGHGHGHNWESEVGRTGTGTRVVGAGRGSGSAGGSETTYHGEEEKETGSSFNSETEGTYVFTPSVTRLGLNDKSNSRFNGFGDIAAGPSDGVARTYTLDLGVENSGSGSGRTGSRRVHYSSADSDSRRRHYSDDQSGNRTYMRERVGESSRRANEGGSYHSESHRSSSGEDLNRDLSGESHGSRSYSSSSGSRHESAHTHREGANTQGGGRSYQEWSKSYSSTSGTADGDSSGHGGFYQAKHISNDKDRTFTQYVRTRREVDNFYDSFDCHSVKCIKVYCTLGAFKKDDEATVSFRSRVWNPTLKKVTSNIKFLVSSQAMARVTNLPHIGRPLAETTPAGSAETISRIIPSQPASETNVIPLWVVVLSSCAGTLILMLLVYALYKCGFFKRNRPSNAPEKQPLNRNGHYNGDEAL
ncbi:integrin alpha-PS2 isoform X2 [Cimex lectularius]|uniref:Integrin alpha-2 domain-containing protein n=1 Tax=Cimex lectularius TaxID=79782 RepID=A0A8I6RCG0_CIMLE|nr:integrin alpha-PS2 isoform X2 [Cimex lectularius]